jgi:quercetin dioxygenase-like cupin family protein
MIVARSADVPERAIKTIEGLPVQGEVHMKPMMAGDQMVMLEIHYPAGSGSPPHVHQHESVVYVLRGKVRMVVDQETFVLDAGDACRHPQGVTHGVEAIEDATILEIKSPVQALEQFLGTG